MLEVIPLAGLFAPCSLRHFFGGYDQDALWSATIKVQSRNTLK